MTVAVRYQLRPANLHEHLAEVEARFETTGPALTVWMPVWTPGSYMVREYARHVQQFAAHDASGTPLAWERVDKHAWRIETAGAEEVRLTYRVYCNELASRTNHLDGTHGHFAGAGLFVSSDAHRNHPARLTVTGLPPDWKAFCALPQDGETFLARDYDELIDSPVEIGPHQPVAFTAAGVPHELVIWGRGNYETATLVKDLTALIEAEARIFGGLPMDRYLFIVLLGEKHLGGLEHAKSTTLFYPRLGFQPQKAYEDFLALSAHEYFHLWNVKRIIPRRLVPFNYHQESYTELLWAFEGITSYYDTYLLRRAGLIDSKRYLEKLGAAISTVEAAPSRRVQSLAEASNLAWIKYYRQDENTPNSGTSYYVKGEVVAMLLDLHLRKATGGKKSLDDVMRTLFERYGDGSGVPEEGIEQVACELGGQELKGFFDRAIRSTEELDYSILEAAGIAVHRRPRKNSADKGGTREDVPAGRTYLGLELRGERGTVSHVLTGSPAAEAGIYADDELLAMDGLRITASSLYERLDTRKPGDKIRLTLFRRDELLETVLTLGERPSNAVWLEPRAEATEEQKRLFEGWLGEAPRP